MTRRCRLSLLVGLLAITGALALVVLLPGAGAGADRGSGCAGPPGRGASHAHQKQHPHQARCSTPAPVQPSSGHEPAAIVTSAPTVASVPASRTTLTRGAPTPSSHSRATSAVPSTPPVVAVAAEPSTPMHDSVALTGLLVAFVLGVAAVVGVSGYRRRAVAVSANQRPAAHRGGPRHRHRA